MKKLTQKNRDEAFNVAGRLRLYANTSHILGAYTEEKCAHEGADMIEHLVSLLDQQEKPNPICKKCGVDMSTLAPGTIHRTPGCEARAFWDKYKNHLDKPQEPV